jgi:membrane protein
MAGIRQKLKTAFQVIGGIREARQILHDEAEQKQAQTKAQNATTGRKAGAASFAATPPRVSTRAKEAAPTTTPPVPVSAPGAATTHGDLSKVHGAWGYARELYSRFNGDYCPAWAAALSFFSILSFVPILICGIAVLGLLIQDPHVAAQKVQGFVTTLIPGGNASGTAAKIIADAQIEKRAADVMRISGIASVVGIVSLFWAASRIFVNAATPMNAAFRTKESRGFLQMQMYAFGLMIGAGALFLLSLLPASGPALLRQIPFLSNLQDPSPWYMDILFFIVGVAINAAMFTVIYRFLPSPSAKVYWKQAAFAGVIIALLWEAAKQGFARYLENFGGNQGYDKVYGSLGGLIILILWVYYSSMILLLGAEIAKLYQDHQEQKGAGDRE